MLTITKRFTRFPWYGPDLVLSSSFPWKANITQLGVISSSGAGRSTYSPTNSFNSYTTIRTGDVVELDAKNIPNGGFSLDNGTAPVGLPQPSITSFTPTSGPIGTVITVTGTNLSGVTAATVNGFLAATSNNTATSIQLTVPNGTLTGLVTLVTPAGMAFSGNRFALAVANITPTAPVWAFDTQTRILSLSHPDYPATELEISLNNGAYIEYAALSIDAQAHPAGEFTGRVKAAAGRNAGTPANSPIIAAVIPPDPDLLVRFQAASLTLADGAGVTTWTNEGILGANANLQPGPGQVAPAYLATGGRDGKPCVRFTAGDFLQTVNALGLGPQAAHTVYIVCRLEDPVTSALRNVIGRGEPSDYKMEDVYLTGTEAELSPSTTNVHLFGETIAGPMDTTGWARGYRLRPAPELNGIAAQIFTETQAADEQGISDVAITDTPLRVGGGWFSGLNSGAAVLVESVEVWSRYDDLPTAYMRLAEMLGQ